MHAILGADAHMAHPAPMNPLEADPPPTPAGPSHRHVLCGRRRECEALDRLVADLRAGQSQVLVVRGEAGVGKTALLEYLLERAAGCRIARTAGVESEMGLAFAGLHQLCAPFLARLERLPGPQRDAMGTAFSLQDGDPPDRFASGLAVLNLLSGLAEERPLVCVVDNAQWLDRALAAGRSRFVARRLVLERSRSVWSSPSAKAGRPATDLPAPGGASR